MASANLFAQYLQPPKSVADYTAEMDEADLRREQLAGSRQQNALAALAMQQSADKQRREAAIRQRAEGYMQQAGGDRNALLALYDRDPDLMGEAQGIRKADLDARNTESQIKGRDADADAKSYETRIKMHETALRDIAGFTTPQEAAASLQRHVAARDIDAATAQSILQDIPQDPNQFPGWQLKMLRRALSARDQLEQDRLQATQAETVRHNRTSETLTARGQNLTDSRAREGNDIKRAEVQMGGKPPPGYRWVGDGRLEAIPGGPGDKLPEAQQKQVVGTQNLSNAITEYRSELANWSKLKAMSPSARAAMGTKYNNMMLQAKEAYNLGVLNGPDYDILTSVITDPRSLSGAITPNTALDKQASELDRIMGGIAKTSGNRRPQDGAPAVAAGNGGPTKAAGAFSDPDKEARYQAWKEQQGRQ